MLAHLPLVALCRRHVDGLLAVSCWLLVLDKCHAFAAGVILRHTVVVPQHAIALARQHHRQRNLCVDLSQTARESAYIGIAVLKLPQTIEVFILGRHKGHRGLLTLHVVARGGKDNTSLFILDLQQLAFLVYLYTDVVLCHLILAHIAPVGQLLGQFATLVILDAYGITCHILHRQLSLSKGHCLSPRKLHCYHS